MLQVRRSLFWIFDGVMGRFQCHNTSGSPEAVLSTQPLTEMNTRNISLGVIAAGA